MTFRHDPVDWILNFLLGNHYRRTKANRQSVTNSLIFFGKQQMPLSDVPTHTVSSPWGRLLSLLSIALLTILPGGLETSKPLTPLQRGACLKSTLVQRLAILVLLLLMRH